MTKPILPFIDPSIALNPQFTTYLTNKSVALIGRSELDLVQQGEFIDSHDVVIRMHEPTPYSTKIPPEHNHNPPSFIPAAWHNFIGRKTSVFYHRIMGGAREWHRRLIAQFREDGGAFFCCDREGNCWKPESADIWNTIPVRYLTLDHFVFVAQLINAKPLAGTIILCDILRQPIKSLYITGLPCWVDTQGNISMPSQDLLRYKFSPWQDFNFVKELSHNPRVTVDDNMQSLFNNFGKWIEPSHITDSPIQAGITDQ